MHGVLAAELAKLLELKLVRGLLLVFRRRVILPLALSAVQTNDHAHDKTSSRKLISTQMNFSGRAGMIQKTRLFGMSSQV
jgi:hypothetical protein